jgi:hypothetical protein
MAIGAPVWLFTMAKPWIGIPDRAFVSSSLTVTIAFESTWCEQAVALVSASKIAQTARAVSLPRLRIFFGVLAWSFGDLFCGPMLPR